MSHSEEFYNVDTQQRFQEKMKENRWFKPLKLEYVPAPVKIPVKARGEIIIESDIYDDNIQCDRKVF